MKKTSIAVILIGLFFSLNISAQNTGLTTEQKMLPFALGASLSVIGEMHDEQNLSVLTIFQKQLPHWSKELLPVVEMSKDAPNYKRLDIAQTATNALRAKSNDSDKWQMLVGERFGTIYAMLKKNRANGIAIN